MNINEEQQPHFTNVSQIQIQTDVPKDNNQEFEIKILQYISNVCYNGKKVPCFGNICGEKVITLLFQFIVYHSTGYLTPIEKIDPLKI